ncbi:hypothetical protein NST11_18930 [Caldifermentibacillus hisashii]|uniref:hypothetical protein n=1 Tax=Caldifermentibacillus hisashii TaxID=996558 RepID=UPI0031B7E6AA
MTTSTSQQLTSEQAVEMANEILRLEAVLKTMKDQLKRFVEENGELVVGDTVWKFQESISWDFESNKIKDFMKSLIIDGYTTNPYELVSFSKAKLDKLGLEEQYLTNFAKKKVTARFVNRKA